MSDWLLFGDVSVCGIDRGAVGASLVVVLENDFKGISAGCGRRIAIR